MNNKKSQMGSYGFKTLMVMVLVIAIGILLIVILARSTGIGQEVLGKIRGFFPFI